MKTPLEFFAYQFSKFAHRFVPHDFRCDDKNAIAFRSASQFLDWYCQPPGPDGNPYRDRLFYVRELAWISQDVEPKSILEIGTNMGVGTLLLRILNPDARIVTIDNRSHVPAADNKTYPSGFLATLNNCGHEQVIKDSALLETSPFQMVFIDGDHGYFPVVKDSDTALECVKRFGNGSIIWHDYAPGSPDVIQAVDDFCSATNLTLNKLEDSGTVWTTIP